MARITFLRDPELSALVNLVDSMIDHLSEANKIEDIEFIINGSVQSDREERIVRFLNGHSDVDFRIWRLKDPGRKR